MTRLSQKGITGVAGLLLGLGSCTHPAATTEMHSVAPLRPMLATARDPQITVFGEFPERPEVPYTTRTATSLMRHSFAEEGADFDPDIDSTGRWMVYASTQHNLRPDLYIKDVNGAAVVQLTADPASDVQPACSPDGQWVAFTSDRTGNWDIWLVRSDGTELTQVTRNPEDEVHPSWSPDGKQIAFCSLPRTGGQWEIWVTDATGGATKRFIGYGLFPEWSPRGDRIVFQRARQRGSRWFSIWTVELVQGEPRNPTEIAASAESAMITPSWAPEGDRVAYCSVTANPGTGDVGSATVEVADVWTVGADGRGRIRLTDGQSANYGPVWSADGRVFFTSTRGGHESIWSLLPMAEGLSGTTEGEGSISGRTDPSNPRGDREAS